MTVNLPNELQKFCGHSHRLRQIFEDTQRCFGDINFSGNVDGNGHQKKKKEEKLQEEEVLNCTKAQIVTAELLEEEKAEIVQTVEHPPVFVVFGQTPYAKARLVNELFSKPILPYAENVTSMGKQWLRVRFKQENSAAGFNSPSRTSYTVYEDFEMVDSSLDADNFVWKKVSLQDLIVSESESTSEESACDKTACLDVIQNHPLLRFGSQVIVAPSGPTSLTAQDVKLCMGQGPSVLLYGVASDSLHEKDVHDLGEIGKVTNFQPIAFVRVPPPGSRTTDTDAPDGAPRSSSNSQPGLLDSSLNSRSLSRTVRYSRSVDSGCGSGSHILSSSLTASTLRYSSTDLHRQLCRLGYLPESEEEALQRQALARDYSIMESIFVGHFYDFLPTFSLFARQAFQNYLINAAAVMNNSHTRCLKMFIMSAFDMARDLIITPKKLLFAQDKEKELYKALMAIAVSKINEIRDLVAETIIDISKSIQQEAADYDFAIHGIDTESGKLSSREIIQCTEKIQDLVLSRLNNHVAGKLLSSLHVLRDSYTGTLTRCLQSLEDQADSPEEARTTDALRQILNAAYQVEITFRSSSSFIHSLLEKMKQLMMSMPWKTPPQVDSEWKRKVASDMLDSLSETRLAKSIASQIKERLNRSHQAFATALQQLETKHTGRLHRIEEQRLKLRKVHAPRLAKLALESTSLKDIVLHGMPAMGREIGRGQYGVVYSCERWASYSPVAIKSVVPPDEKHWNDLALEFFYTKNIPEHPHVVALRGSVIDYMYGGGMSPAVLLVMDRLHRDLYTAIKQGLAWQHRLQVSIDVVDGLRFLHSQGLIHRDVKLKNVLLGKDNRGKITDLGFCKPEAMMSGSIVGTPIHMAPELFTGHYDNTVDVYAFGILFWYACAGHVHLPSTFERCLNKDQLWQSVIGGLRPERLSTFTSDCWDLMQSCWDKEPTKRPYFGDVEQSLSSMLSRVQKTGTESVAASSKRHSPSETKKKSSKSSTSMSRNISVMMNQKRS